MLKLLTIPLKAEHSTFLSITVLFNQKCEHNS